MRRHGSAGASWLWTELLPLDEYARRDPISDGPRLAGRVSVVTGAGKGIGQAIAARFRREGSTVIGVDVQFDIRHSDVHSPERFLPLTMDIGTPDAARKVTSIALDRFGRVDILVNNAAIQRRGADLANGWEEWRRLMDVNVLALASLCKEQGRAMADQGDGGAIINIASVSGLIAFPNQAIYAASKGAVLALTRALAVDFAGWGVRVNAICPGPTLSGDFAIELESETGPSKYADLLKAHPLGRFADVDQIASAALFLASDDASHVTGASLLVDGGYSIR